MKACLMLAACFGILGLFACHVQTPQAGPIVLVADAPHLQAQVAGLSARAAKENRRLLVYFHAHWCEPCRMLDAAFMRPAEHAALRRWYLLKVDVDELPTTNVLGLSVEFIPLLARINSQGRVEATLEGEAFGPDPEEGHVDQVLVHFLGS